MGGTFMGWRNGRETESVPTRVIVPQRVVEHIGVAVQHLGIARLGDDGVGLDEATQGGVVVAGFVIIEAQVCIPALARVLAVGG